MHIIDKRLNLLNLAPPEKLLSISGLHGIAANIGDVLVSMIPVNEVRALYSAYRSK